MEQDMFPRLLEIIHRPDADSLPLRSLEIHPSDLAEPCISSATGWRQLGADSAKDAVRARCLTRTATVLLHPLSEHNLPGVRLPVASVGKLLPYKRACLHLPAWNYNPLSMTQRQNTKALLQLLPQPSRLALSNLRRKCLHTINIL